MMMNTSGIEPLDLRVLVLPDNAEKVTAGGIFLPDSVTERDKFAKIEATVVAVGENAWEEAAARSPRFTKPQPGDRVLISKYGGIMHTGADKRDYRILNDEDIIARIA